ncbi:hypothetical protein BD414DRAFT_76058 [Trametes punicea]|nr:hypothetical protein BD414DRAFT_76058 [Trametes punicea]
MRRMPASPEACKVTADTVSHPSFPPDPTTPIPTLPSTQRAAALLWRRLLALVQPASPTVSDPDPASAAWPVFFPSGFLDAANSPMTPPSLAYQPRQSPSRCPAPVWRPGPSPAELFVSRAPSQDPRQWVGRPEDNPYPIWSQNRVGLGKIRTRYTPDPALRPEANPYRASGRSRKPEGCPYSKVTHHIHRQIGQFPPPSHGKKSH